MCLSPFLKKLAWNSPEISAKQAHPEGRGLLARAADFGVTADPYVCLSAVTGEKCEYDVHRQLDRFCKSKLMRKAWTNLSTWAVIAYVYGAAIKT